MGRPTDNLPPHMSDGSVSHDTDEEHACVEALAGHCGRGLLRRSTVVFTHGDEFENDDDELQRFLREAPTALQVGWP